MTLALAVVALALALLCLPIWVELSLEEGWRFHARVHWATLRGPASSAGTAPSPGGSRRRTPRKKSSRAARRKVRALLRSPDFLPSLVRLGRRLVLHLRPRHLRLRCELGLGDPADTGCAWGVLAPLFVLLARLEAEAVEFRPDFARRTFSLEGRAVVRIVPGVVLALVAGYFLTRAPWRALARFARA